MKLNNEVRIAISGKSGCGNTTVSTLLSEKLIVDYVKETRCALILVTHSLQQARRLADRVLYLHKGKLLEQGPKEQVLEAPAKEETRKFLEFYGI